MVISLAMKTLRIHQESCLIFLLSVNNLDTVSCLYKAIIVSNIQNRLSVSFIAYRPPSKSTQIAAR